MRSKGLRQSQKFPSTRTVINTSYLSDGPESPFVAVVYHAESTIKESTPVLPHGNTTKDSFITKPYIRTNKGVLEKTKQMVWDGEKPKTIYDTINNNTGDVYFSTSQALNLETVNKYTEKVNNLKPKRNVVTKIMIKNMS